MASNRGNLLMTNIGRDEAVAILAGWADAGTLVRCDLRLDAVALCVRVRLRVVAPDRLDGLSEDTRGELVLPLPPSVLFGVGSYADGSPDDAASYGVALGVFFSASEDAESVTFMEVL